MFIIHSYFIAILFCVVTMFCWGLWVNTLKITPDDWTLPLYYWDYTWGMVIIALILAFTLGSFGHAGRSFIADLSQGSLTAYFSAFIGGVVFNLSNLLVVAAIDIAGMSVGFPIGVGLALVIGVITNYVATPLGNPFLLFIGVGLVVIAIILDAFAYKRLSGSRHSTPVKGIVLAVTGGILMGFFFRLVAASISTNYAAPASGMFTPYSGVFVFSIGVLISSFIWNPIFMIKPPDGKPVTIRDYFVRGNKKSHLIGIAGGIIWNIGMAFSMIASQKAGFAISFGLSEGATMVATGYGVFIWKEFADAPKGTNKLLFPMFTFFIAGLLLIVFARMN